MIIKTTKHNDCNEWYVTTNKNEFLRWTHKEQVIWFIKLGSGDYSGLANDVCTSLEESFQQYSIRMKREEKLKRVLYDG